MIKKRHAFTLIELIISSLIFTVVMVTIHSAFQTGIFGQRSIEETLSRYQSSQQALRQLNLDLRNSFRYSENQSMFTGNQNEISFLTLVDTYSQDQITPNFALVSYKLAGNKLTRLCQKNKESLKDRSEIEPEEMLSGINQIDFSYGYPKIDTGEILWKDSWENEKSLPAAVKVKLIFKDKIKQNFQRVIFLPLA